MTSSPTARLRLDLALVARGLVASRARAQDLIRRGLVSVDGSVESKTGALVGDGARVLLAGDGTEQGVSRGGIKLVAALDAFKLSPAGRVCLDVGASTGGFTEVLLRRGARRVYAVDVGRDQLHASLKSRPEVVSLEERDARTLTVGDIPEPIEAIVADVSFISATLALPVPLSFAASAAWLVALVKPQFEAGREAVGKGGLVRSEQDRERAVNRVRDWLAAQPGWRILGVVPSPITGGSGNVEHLLGAQRHA